MSVGRFLLLLFLALLGAAELLRAQQAPPEDRSFLEQAREAAKKGDNVNAIKLYEMAVQSALKVLKEDDIEIVMRRAELGEAYRAAGRWDEAITQLDYAWKRLRSSGNGDAGPKGGASGDLYVVISIRDHELFERDGHDLHCNVPLGYPVAALGGELAVPTLDGKANVRVPAGTQNGAVFRLKGQGVKHLESDRKGDLYVHVQIAVPTKLSSEQKEKLQEFAKALGDNHSPLHETFLEKAKKFFF